MGYTVHNAIIVTADSDRLGGLPDMDATQPPPEMTPGGG